MRYPGVAGDVGHQAQAVGVVGVNVAIGAITKVLAAPARATRGLRVCARLGGVAA